MTIEVPLEDLTCAKCKSESGVHSPAEIVPYVIVNVGLPGSDQKEALMVPLDVRQVEWRNVGDGRYTARAVISLPCPSCGNPQELRYNLEAPVILLKSISKCRSCGGQLILKDEEVVYRESREDGASIEVKGIMWCRICSSGSHETRVLPTVEFSLLERAGTVDLNLDPPLLRVGRAKVFISYSHKDKLWLERLQTYLAPLERNGLIERWDDTRISPSGQWRSEITQALSSSKIAVLLVSPNFLASPFIVEHELPPLLDAAEKGGLKILWVAVGASLYTETQIANYQALNNPARPLESLSRAERGQVLVRICEIIRDSVKTA